MFNKTSFLANLLKIKKLGHRKSKESSLDQPEWILHQGYTLIELLVAMLIAGLVIAPLIGLAVSLLQTDRQEQAKAATEQTIQDASNYIARDLEQAIFIYDGEALTSTGIDGIQDQIPPVAPTTGCDDVQTCQPVLAFWKRRPVKDVLPRDYQNQNNRGVDCTVSANADQCNDTFVYSLVTYYLIYDPNNANDVWSNTARIGRFEISDGASLPGGSLLEDINQNMVLDSNKRDDGFQPFSCQQGESVESCMNRWDKDAPAYANPVQILMDYVDQTPPNTPDVPQPENCDNLQPPNGGVANQGNNLTWSATPQNTPTNFPNSFSACVWNQQGYVARFYIRGNAHARFQSANNPLNYTNGRSAYFPEIQTEIQAKGRFIQ